MAIHPTTEQIQALVDGPADTPVVMLNLLKFADRASGDAGDDAMSGARPTASTATASGSCSSRPAGASCGRARPTRS